MLFLVGTFWFFVLLGAVSLALVILLENDKWGWSLLAVVLTFILLATFGNFNLLTLILHEPVKAGLLVLAYGAVGALWSVIKWYFFLMNRKDKYKTFRANFLNSLGMAPGDGIPEDEKGNFQKALKSYGNHDKSGALNIRPYAKAHKKKISVWVAYWPWSACLTLLRDPVKRISLFLFDCLHDLYEAMSRRVYKDVANDMPDTLKSKAEIVTD